MTLTQLLYFAAVARTGSYSTAAGEFDVAESVVYKSVRLLEREFAVKLVERVDKRVCLTPGGRAIYDYADQMSSLARLTSQAVTEHKGILQTRISIGGDVTVTSCLLPDVLAQWAIEHPNTEIAITQGRKQEFEELLLQDCLDLLISSDPKQVPGLRRELLYFEPLVVVCVPTSSLSQTRIVTLYELSRERMIFPARGTPIRHEIEQLQYDYGVQFRLVAEVNRQHAIRLLCAKGIGIAILPMSTVAEDISNNRLRVVNVEAFPRSCPYFLIQRALKVTTPEVSSLISLIKEWVSARNKLLSKPL